MSFLLSLRSLLLYLVLAVTANAANNANIGRLFTVDPTTCAGMDLDTLFFDDASTLLASAQTALDTVIAAKKFPLGDRSRNLMRNARNMFGTSYYTVLANSGIYAEDNIRLNLVKMNLGYIQDLLAGRLAGPAGGQAQLAPANAYIYCSDTPYATTTVAQDIDPTQQQGTPVRDVYGVPSLFVHRGVVNAQGIQRRVLKPNPNLAGAICQRTVTALTQPQNLFTPNEPAFQMVLCPHLFNPASNFRTPLKPQGGATPRSTASKTDWKYMAGVFVHEMLHMIGNDRYNDWKFRVKKDQSLVDPYGPATIFGLATSPSGFERVFGDGLTTINLPDANRLFCEMSIWPDTKWRVK